MQATQRQAVSTGLFRIRRVSLLPSPRGFCRWFLPGQLQPGALNLRQYIRNIPHRGVLER